MNFHLIKSIAVMGVILLLLCGAAFSASLMLFSPRKWFDMPLWLIGGLKLRRKHYEKGWRAVEVRFAGGLMLSAAVYTLYELFFGRR